jgi:hypothetical protein
MITKKDLKDLYEWSKTNNFPIKCAPTAEGYSNKPIKFCWIKKNIKTIVVRKSIIQNFHIQSIYENPDILFSMYVIFDENTRLGPHKDPNIYKEPYKRIQIPIEIPDKEKCYMIWKGEKVHWKEGNPQLFEVMDYVHEGYNLTNKPMKFLFLDVKKSAEVEVQ